MSLFGSSPDDPTPSAQQNSLFEDKSKNGIDTNTSLFDDDGNETASHWGMPTPKKAARNDVIKQLLPSSDVPESYIDAYDTIVEAGGNSGTGINLTGVKSILENSRLSCSDQAGILKLVAPDRRKSFGRSEFNVLLALIGLVQENEDATLDGVDERRRNLPEPSLPYINQLKTAKVSDNLSEASPQEQASTPPLKRKPPGSSPPKSRRLRKDSLDNLEVDPWSSPDLHKGHTHTVNNEATPRNGPTMAVPINSGPTGSSRTTSAFTTHAEEPSSDSSMLPVSNSEGASGDAGGAGWGSYNNPGHPGLGAEGFGSGGDDSANPNGNTARRPVIGGRAANRGAEEVITVTLLPEKEGMFLFQHRNYEVKSTRRSSSVVRRYSDFVWLLDCLYKRYPFRQLPLLPPKTLAVNGRHLSADATFVEKRRRGLVRFANALVRHPVLSQEQLVVMFLTVPTELAVWRKQATISVQEEFIGKALPPGLEDSLPTNLSDTFDTVRAGVRKSADEYINLCTLLERLAKRNQGVAADHLRFSLALTTLIETSESTYATDTNDVPLLNEGISSTAKHLSTCQSLLEDETRAWDEGVLEDFKRQRDTLVSIRDMFDRRDRYAKDNIPQLERRIENNENKLAGLRGRPEGTVKVGEPEKLEQAILNDKQSIVNQHARGVFIKECIRDELVFFQQSQYHISRMHQDWSQERIKYAELQADNWRALSEEVENMPLGD